MSYVKGQALVSLIIGTSAGIGIWLLGVLGWLPGGEKYALLFGAWVAITELLPYIGPWLGAIPPFIYALVVHPISAIWVGLLFLGIHQIEGHVVVPNVMGSALRLHPLLVIFGLLAGGEIYGLPGALVALPMLAAGRAMWEFFSERVELEPWGAGGVPPVEVELEAAPEQPASARARGPSGRGAGRLGCGNAVIEYVASVDDVESADLDGFFVGWPRRPSPERHLALLRGSSHVVLAREGRRVVGFVDSDQRRRPQCLHPTPRGAAGLSGARHRQGADPAPARAARWAVHG